MFTEKSSFDYVSSKLNKLPKNLQIFFGTDCARSVLHYFEDKYPDDLRPRKALEMAESLRHNSKIIKSANNARYSSGHDSVAYYAAGAAYYVAYAAYSPIVSCANVSNCVFAATKSGQSWNFINCLYNHAYNPNPFPKNYKTPDVLNTAQSIIQERDFASCPILADALEDAGCADDILLHHLRNDTIGLSDWALFNLRQDLGDKK
jgi:hypothetical protein